MPLPEPTGTPHEAAAAAIIVLAFNRADLSNWSVPGWIGNQVQLTNGDKHYTIVVTED